MGKENDEENNRLMNDILQQADQMKREKEKLTEEINELKGQMGQREGAYERMRIEIKKLTEENNRLKNDIRHQAEQMKREKEKLTEENNQLKKIHIHGELK